MSNDSGSPMRILIAEDDAVSRRGIESSLDKLGYEVISTSDGASALKVLQSADAPRLALLDWMMPEMDGIDICKSVRSVPTDSPPYIILLTAKTSKESIVEGLDSGADDYVTKPFDRAELFARLQVGCRILELQSTLTDRVRQLEATLAQVKQLEDLVPICSYCKKIRDDQNYWQRVETYLSAKIDARFTHGICPDCFETVIKQELSDLPAGSFHDACSDYANNGLAGQ